MSTECEGSKLVSAYIALGSNIGDREKHLRSAIDQLDASPGIEVKAASGIYETDPVGFTEQDVFLNMVIAVNTTLTAGQLLTRLLEIESALGRTRDVHWGPRTMDLDLLLYGNDRIKLPDLEVPHPRMEERAFVMIPLMELAQAQGALDCGLLAPMKQRFQSLLDKEGVKLWKEHL
jgi:2-amino-4-hydroxy-6-hydroxymethyldihydropteridine diphosphokinase